MHNAPRSPAFEVLFAPAELADLAQRDLSKTICVVFDVLRATTSIVTALANGAAAVSPVADIADALEVRVRDHRMVLAGERDGLRIQRNLTGSIDFDLGNSPREFTAEKVAGRTIVITTTNGTRALRACAHAGTVFVASFLNLRATATFLQRELCNHSLLIVCSGTFEQTAYEDVLAAGALCDLLSPNFAEAQVADSAQIARTLFQLEQNDLTAALKKSRNGRRLLSRPELSPDVDFCAQRDIFPLVAMMGTDGLIRSQH